MVYTNFQNSPYFENNLQKIQKRNPILAEQLNHAPLTNEVIAVKAKNGSPLVAVKHPNGQKIALNDLNDPMQESENWVSSLGKECLQCAHVMLIGFGSGYYPLSLHRLSDQETLIWVVEPNLLLLKAALHLMDFTSLLCSSRIRLIGGLCEDEVVKRLFHGSDASRTRAQGIRLAYPKISAMLHRAYIQRLAKTLSEAIELDKLRFKTEEIQGKQILENITNNFPYILQGAPCLNLQGKGAGLPAFVISPGPSLEEALPIIKLKEQQALLISVDTAYRILYKNGIHSDLVVSLDFTELNARHFDGLDDDTAYLVAYPGVHPEIVKMYEGRTFFFDHSATVDYDSGALPILEKLHSLGTLGKLISYGSTAHSAYHLARFMGCMPIILIGNDLSFPFTKWYAKNAMQHELDQPGRQNEQLLEVEANDGRKVKTSGLYKIYLDTFSELIQKTAGRVINTSVHGAKIQGTVFGSLENVIESFSKTAIDKSFILNGLYVDSYRKKHNLKDEIKHLSTTCRNTKRQLHKLIKRTQSLEPDSGEFHGYIKKIMLDFTSLLSSQKTIFELCIPLCPRSTTAIIGQSGDVGLLGGKNSQQNKLAKERYEQFLTDLKKSADINAEALEKAFKLMQ